MGTKDYFKIYQIVNNKYTIHLPKTLHFLLLQI